MPLKLPEFLKKLNLQNPPEKILEPNPENQNQLSLSPNLLQESTGGNRLKTTLGIFTELYFSKTLLVFQILTLTIIGLYLVLLGLSILMSGLVKTENLILQRKATEVLNMGSTEVKIRDLSEILSFYNTSKQASLNLDSKVDTVISKLPAGVRIIALTYDNMSISLYLESDNALQVASVIDAYLTSKGIKQIVISEVNYDSSRKRVYSSLGLEY